MDAQADATELAPKKSAQRNPPAGLDQAREGCSLHLEIGERYRRFSNKPISWVKLQSGGPGLSIAMTARRSSPGAPN